jgi:hypothetical protein
MSSIISSVLLRRHPKNSGGGRQDGGTCSNYTPLCGATTWWRTNRRVQRGAIPAFALDEGESWKETSIME